MPEMIRYTLMSSTHPTVIRPSSKKHAVHDRLQAACDFFFSYPVILCIAPKGGRMPAAAYAACL